jgi:putative restriction endonuclease
MVRLWVANTDQDWFDFLAAQPNIDEVNFWQPSGATGFSAIQPGELFLFRLKSPRNAIGGYGVFSHSSNLPISLAWEAFGIKNGARTLELMRSRVEQYRDGPPINNDYTIGCRIVVQPVFFPENFWFPQPQSWARSIVVGKTYSTDDPEGLNLWKSVIEAAALSGADRVPDSATGLFEYQARYGEPTLIAPRLGQGAFRVAVTDAYARTCAVSGGKVLPALDAAHIKPYALGGTHSVSNGILLRRDIHSVFDAGYVTVDGDYRFVVSERVKTDFNNGNEYRRLHGTPLAVPTSDLARPDRLLLQWHNNNIFRGS